MIRARVDNQLHATLPIRLKRVDERLQKYVRAAGLRATGHVLRKIDELGISDRGGLKKSMGPKTVRTPMFRAEVRVTSNLVYAPVIHEGREKGKPPPFKPILQWVVRKGITGRVKVVRVGTSQRRKRGERTRLRKEQERIAEAIRWKQFHYGTVGKPFIADTMKEHGRALADALGRILESELPRAFNEDVFL